MKVEPFSFREFGSEVIAGKAAPAKGFVPRGGRAREEEPPPPPPPPSFSEEQLKAAELEGYRKGFLEGVQDGKMQAENEQSEIDRILTEKMEAFVQSITPLFADYSAMALSLRRDVPKVAMAISKKIAGHALSENAQAIVEDMAMRACEHMAGEPKINITVNEKLVATIQSKLSDFAARQQSPMQVMVTADAKMAPADCRIEWMHGSMERCTETLWQHIEAIVADMGTSAARDTQNELVSLAAKLPLTAPVNEIIESPAIKE